MLRRELHKVSAFYLDKEAELEVWQSCLQVVFKRMNGKSAGQKA